VLTIFVIFVIFANIVITTETGTGTGLGHATIMRGSANHRLDIITVILFVVLVDSIIVTKTRNLSMKSSVTVCFTVEWLTSSTNQTSR
jgi:surface polysaccharide O-acyltransferase-like enzyme